jgi:lysylphosphatidylglycerol synthetase-like protein (DUF2156 family)
MTAALRLPDAFTPGRTSAAAATPTCCCCCCCCAVTVVSASVALPSVYIDDVRNRRPKPVARGRRETVATLLALIPWVLVLLLFVPDSELSDLLFSDGFAIVMLAGAAITAMAGGVLSALGGSRTPWRVAAHAVLWTAIGVVEFFAILFSLFTGYLLLVLVLAYLVLLVWLPLKVYARYGPK